MMYLMTAGGLVLLFFGGEWLVRGAVDVARWLGLSPLLIGLTIVGFGTSAPELVVALDAVTGANPTPDLAMGNVLGSNVANILLILGTAALIYPIRIDPKVVRRDALMMFGACVLLVILVLGGTLERWHGVLMLVALAAYIGYGYWTEARGGHPAEEMHRHEGEELSEGPVRPPVAILLVLVGLVALVVGSHLLVEGAVGIATAAGVSDAIIGLTLVAVGTSLPELATTTVAAFRKHTDVAVGNVLGSNIFNVLCILGVTSVVVPVPVGPQLVGFDVWVMVGVAAFVLPFLLRGGIGRVAAVVFLLLYVVYVAALYTADSLPKLAS